MTLSFPSGSTPAMTSSTPACAPIALCGALIITGQHDHADSHVLQFLDRLRAVFLDDICHGNHTKQARPSLHETQRRLAFRRQALQACLLPVRTLSYVRCIYEKLPPASEAAVSYVPDSPLPGSAVKSATSCAVNAAVLPHSARTAFANGCSLFFSRRKRQRSPAPSQSQPPAGMTSVTLRLAAGDRTRLIQRYNVHFAGFLQRNRCLEQDSVFRAHAVADHNRNRRRQSQCARAADDQHGNTSGQRKSERLSSQQPDNRCHHCDSDNRRDKHAGNPVCNLGDRRFRRRRVADHAG